MLQQQHPGACARTLGGEELCLQRRQQTGVGVRGHRQRLGRQHQIEGQHDAPAFGNRQHLVPAIRIEREPAQPGGLQVLRGKARFALAVPDAQLAADVRRGPHEDQRRDHAGVLLRVLVRLEELPGPVDEQAVHPRLESGQAERLGDLDLQDFQCALAPGQRERVTRDFAAVAHTRVAQGGFAQSVAGRHCHGVQRLRLCVRDRLLQRSLTLHRQRQRTERQAAFGGEAGVGVVRPRVGSRSGLGPGGRLLGGAKRFEDGGHRRDWSMARTARASRDPRTEHV